MDLNYLYKRQQVSLFRSENAACEPSRLAHLAMAGVYSARIDAAKADTRPSLHAPVMEGAR